MRTRTKKQLMDREKTMALLQRAQIGHLATVDQDGAPYVVPLQFVAFEDVIYLHGAAEGEKFENMMRDGRMCLEVCQDFGLCYDENSAYACAVNAKYESAVVRGRARFVEDPAEKEKALRCLIRKYVPEFSEKQFQQKSLERTAVIAMESLCITGKEFVGRGENQ